MAKVQIFADVDNITNKRGSDELVIKLVTQEINDTEAGLVMGLRNKYVCVLLSTSEIEDEEAKALPDEFKVAPIVDAKSQSQRLRNVLYRQWEGRYKTRYPEFQSFYEKRMEEIIEEEKSRI